jgi:hypothetical protein
MCAASGFARNKTDYIIKPGKFQEIIQVPNRILEHWSVMTHITMPLQPVPVMSGGISFRLFKLCIDSGFYSPA